ncbi:NUDIX domain-containing protein [Metabacillus fastidiosus]|uniref:NUDIX domain-containing protein n=1 Tax=Metabacillus fastidiosus TaxID=1458 RepID=UPI003D2BAD39
MTYPIRVRTSALIIQDNKVLLVEFKDENGLHYNLPGGGVESGETLVESVKREALEEASVHIEVHFYMSMHHSKIKRSTALCIH